MKTSDLIGPALDWAVAKCEGYRNLRWHTHPAMFSSPPYLVMDHDYDWKEFSDLSYSTDWSQGGLIIEREGIAIRQHLSANDNQFHGEWEADTCNYRVQGRGPTPLIAAMRCFVASKLGDEVDIPKELQ